MRQWDDVDARLASRHDLHRSNLFNEWTRREELLDRDAPHRQDELWLEELDFAIEPGTAIEQLFRGRHAIAALRILAGEAAARGGDVHARSELFFVQAEREEPFE